MAVARMALVALVIAIVATFGRPAGTAPASGPCASRQMVLETLARRFGERVVAVGVTSTDWLMIITATPDGARWSRLLSQPDGLTCLHEAGVDWRVYPTVPRPPERESNYDAG